MERSLRRTARSGTLLLLLAVHVWAQDEQPSADPHAGHQMPDSGGTHDMAGMAGHDMSAHNMGQSDMNDAGMYLMRMASGTSRNPLSWPMPMLMPKLGSWNTMIMGQGFLVDTQQGGPRGADKLYSPNWIMGSAIHKLGKGSVMFQTMFSLDPATITNRRYPLLFQTGETAYGTSLVDAQHPHDLFMGLGVHYARPLSENTMLQLYYAPVGDPALGPVAFPHRASAFELPQATLSHHVQDSTHIATNVATAAIQYRWLRFEASGFHGREPNENRWNIDFGKMDSYSGRISVFPAANWMAQFSAGRMSSPELHQLGDVIRMTASLHYTRPTSAGNAWSTSLIWGRNHNTFNQQNLNSYLVETLYPVTKRDFLTARAEIVDKNELFAYDHELEDSIAARYGSSFRIQSYTGGYTHDVNFVRYLETGIGANATAYAIPSALKPFYGDHPWGVSMYLRVRVKKNQ